MPRDVDEVKEFTRQEKRIIEEYDRKLDTATDLAVQEMLFYLDKEIKEIFLSAINEFYEDYSPVEGGYIRDYSMRSLLETNHVTGDNPKLEFWFEPSNMTAFRNGYDGEDGLYDQTFRKGWHGGADMGPKHPEIGTPYWRTPRGVYKHWGEKAEIADTPPIDRFFDELNSAAPRFSDELGRLIDKYVAQVFGK